ncbi:DedA family protein [Carboxydothermus hydrogenoformans]|uniref:DedA protein n=1 Tax=Carboxydothermus hydrogenoformans (strain ATCC BAA-161 / DSM 6008 / Z-2901) TaxID=246194 RepID=Q3AB44_CARHZ|nr:DedA family protein [Carboxydothermus hydrogenoformans]ABB15323.1 dedA protein [Carboxydothermus hydrogenoformans Z-2901]
MGAIWDLILHLDKNLDLLLQRFGTETYFILFLIVFLETGLVVTPFLPGDSLLFAAGALSALGSLNIYLVMLIFIFAAVLGNTSNYFIARFFSNAVLNKKNLKFIKQEHLLKTQRFYEKYGPVTIVLARFVPIVRTFAPFVAGIGRMNFFKFSLYNLIGAFLWVFLLTLAGYYFGNIPVIKDNFSLVVIAIILISILPGLISFIKKGK